MEDGPPALPPGAKVTEWQPLGDALSRHPRMEVNAPSIALLPDSTPLVAWAERVTGTSSLKPVWAVRVSRWSGSEWVDLGTDLRGPTARVSTDPALLVDRVTGTPIIAWNNLEEATVQIQSWDGRSWLPLGQALGETQFSRTVQATSLAQDQEGQLWVAWSSGCYCTDPNVQPRLEVARWNGTSWSQLPNPPAVLAKSLDLKIDASGHPIIAASIFKHDGRLSSAPASVIRAYRWDENAGWTDLGEVAQLRLPASSSRSSLALDATHAPTIAWFDPPSLGDERGPVTVKQWNGQGWSSLGAVNANASAVTLSTTPDGALLLGHSGGVLTWDGSAWNTATASQPPVSWQSHPDSALFASPDGTLHGAFATDGVQVRVLK
jgi:hypothetical protein